MTIRLALFAKYPRAGFAKTRLIFVLGEERAARLHAILAERTVRLLQQTGEKFELHYTGALVSEFEKWLGSDIEYVAQPEGDLTARLMAAMAPAPVIFLGSDTPDLQARHIEQAVAALTNHDVVIGPAVDGGYYLIGMREELPFLLEDMPWSTSEVLPETLRRLAASGHSVAMLEELHDCDRPSDLDHWPWLLDESAA